MAVTAMEGTVMRKLALVAAVLLASMAVGVWHWRTRAPDPPPPPAMTDDQAGKDEAIALTNSNGLVWRDGAALNFRMKPGQSLTLTDRVSCGDLPCPPDLAARYRYLGWDGEAGGYRVRITPSAVPEMILTYGDEEAMLVDARHAARMPDAPVTIPTPPLASQPDTAVTDWLAGISDERRQIELPLFAASEGKAGREGARLIIQLNDGRRLALPDDLVCGQVSCPPQLFRSLTYAGRSPDGRFHVVEEHWDEASGAMLVDATSGAVTPLIGIPKFSPDGSRLVATVADLEWPAPRRLELWSLSGAAPGIEFSLPAKEEDDTIYEVIGWNDSDHARLRRGVWATDVRSEVMLAHDASGWHIEGSDGGN